MPPPAPTQPGALQLTQLAVRGLRGVDAGSTVTLSARVPGHARATWLSPRLLLPTGVGAQLAWLDVTGTLAPPMRLLDLDSFTVVAVTGAGVELGKCQVHLDSLLHPKPGGGAAGVGLPTSANDPQWYVLENEAGTTVGEVRIAVALVGNAAVAPPEAQAAATPPRRAKPPTSPLPSELPVAGDAAPVQGSGGGGAASSARHQQIILPDSGSSSSGSSEDGFLVPAPQPMRPGDYTVLVHILEGRSLHPEDREGTSDPFVYVDIGPSPSARAAGAGGDLFPKQRQTTRVVKAMNDRAFFSLITLLCLPRTLTHSNALHPPPPPPLSCSRV